MLGFPALLGWPHNYAIETKVFQMPEETSFRDLLGFQLLENNRNEASYVVNQKKVLSCPIFFFFYSEKSFFFYYF